jgi:sugar lactone lactonase YvrE
MKLKRSLPLRDMGQAPVLRSSLRIAAASASWGSAQLGSVRLRTLATVLLAALFGFTTHARAEDYTFTTFAGQSSEGSADGLGQNARFFSPKGIAVDAAGNIYVADSANYTVRRITQNGIVSTVAGVPGESGPANGTGAQARFYYPESVAVDGAGDVYVAEADLTIRKITPDGMVSTVPAQVLALSGLAIDTAGSIYVSDSNAIEKITSSGTLSVLAGVPGGSYGYIDAVGTDARFDNPRGLAVDRVGNVYVADSGNNAIRKITPTGAVSTMVGSTHFKNPWAVAVDDAGNIYVADSGNHIIRTITPTGFVRTLAGLAGVPGSADGLGNSARFFQPQGVALDSAGKIYVTESGNNTVRKITPDGLVSTLAGSASPAGYADGISSQARFSAPQGIAVDGATNIYVAESGNNTIRKITPAGQVSTLAGAAGGAGSEDGTGAEARFSGPQGIAADSVGNIFVADSGNNTIRKITPAGLVSTLAGLAGTPGTADGYGSEARFYYPWGVAVDSLDNVYVADSWNNTIRKITPGGIVSTMAGLPGATGSKDGVGSGALFSGPQGIAVDSLGNVYVADSRNGSIRKITPAGVVSTLAQFVPFPEPPSDGSDVPDDFFGLAIDTAGNLYVANWIKATVHKITPGGVASIIAGLTEIRGSTDGTGSVARFWGPSGVAVDSAGNIYVADSANNSIRKGVVLPGRSGPRIIEAKEMTGDFKIMVQSSGASTTQLELDSASALPDTIQWTAETNAIFSVNAAGTFEVDLPMTPGTRFFRVRLNE